MRSFKSFVPWRAFVAVGLLLIGAVAFGMFARPAALAQQSVRIAFEKNLALDRKSGYGAFAWRPDSKAIAYIRFFGGHVGLVDVDTGKDVGIPDVQLNGLIHIAWSADAKFLAVSSCCELAIIRMADFKVISKANVFVDYKDWKDPNELGETPRFGEAMAFSSDDKTLIFNTTALNFVKPHPFGFVLLYSYDIASKRLTPLVKSPTGSELKAFPYALTSRFVRWRGRLFFSTLIMRGDRAVFNSIIVNRVDYGGGATPTSCYVFDLGDGQRLVSTRQVDFPLTEAAYARPDLYPNVLDCAYSPVADRVIAERREFYYQTPGQIQTEKPWFYAESVDLKRPADKRAIGKLHIADSRGVVTPIPFRDKPWILIQKAVGNELLMSIRDVKSGRTISVFEAPGPFYEFQISPDGRKLAARIGDGVTLPIYDVATKGD